MAAKRRIINKVQIQRPSFFEDQAWPMHVSLACLAVLLIVFVSTLGGVFFSFNSDQIAFAITAVVAVYIAAAVLLSAWWPKTSKRRHSLAFCISLAFNLMLLLLSSAVYLKSPQLVVPDEVTQVDKEKEEQKIVEIDLTYETGQDRMQNELESPVEAGAPGATGSEIQKKQTLAVDAAQETPDQASESAPELTQAIPKLNRKTQASVPRLADSKGTLSKQLTSAKPNLGKPTVESFDRPETPQPTPVPADAGTLQRQTPQLAAAQMDDSAEPTSPEISPDNALTRKDRTLDAPKIASAEPTLQRQVDVPQFTPRTDVASNSTAVSAESTLAEFKPQSTPESRQPTQLPMPSEPQNRLTSDLTAEPSPRQIARRQPDRVEPQLEESNAQNITRQLTQNTLLADTQVATEDNSNPTEAAPTETPTSSASPAQMTVSKTDATLDSPSPQANPANETAIAAVPTNVTPERRIQADSPQDISKPTHQLTRDATQLATPNLESVVQDTSVRPKSSDIDSTPDDAVASAVTRAKQGIAGAGVEPNFDRETPAQASLVTTGSASAKRASSTQAQEGPALAPSDAPEIKRAVAEASVPSASLYAQEVDAAVTSGADQPADIDLAASSSVTKAGANAMPAPVSAQQGTAEVDFGPTRIAASVGLQKAAGGGQPEPNLRPSQSLGMARDVAGAGSFAAPTNARNVSPQRPSGSDTPTSDQPSPVALQVANVNTNGGPAQLLANAAGQANTNETELAPSATAPSTALPSRATQSSSSELNDIVARSGGGSNQPLRKSQGTRIFVPSSAETVTLAGENASSGVPDAAPVAANNQAHRRTPTGIVGPIENDQTGALAADVQLDGANAGPSEMLPGRISSAELADPVGPMPVSQAGQGLQVARHIERQLPTGALGQTKVEIAPIGTRSETIPDTFLENPALAVSTGPMSRPSAGGLVVQTEATAGLGGFVAETGPSVALRRRTGLAESEFIAKLPERFLRREMGSPIPLPNPKPVPTDAYQTRINRRGEANAGGSGRPSAKTEQAIEMGLVFLSRNQSPDGSWSLNFGGDGKTYRPNETPIMRSDTAATGLALLSFLGAGYHHQDDKYKDVVKKGLEFLLAHQDDDGNLFIPQDENSAASAGLYSHGIAAIALSEAYGMTQDDWLREPAQRSLNYISAAQHESRGGWRYTPGISADTSVSGWMMMALRSGELANLDVSVETLELIEKWLDSAKASKAEPHLFRYNPYAPNNATQGHGRIPSKTMTAVGLLMRLYTGWSRDKAEMVAGAEYLLQNLPSVEMEDNVSQRDTYYWYYATQVMFHMRDEYWEKWNQALHPLLVDTQIIEGPLAGSWDPFYPVADRWAPHGGRLYVTTLNLLSLEVYYRHLPIYEDTAQ